MPHEVFDACFQPAIDAYGWPFSSVAESADGTRWEKFFQPCSLLQWSKFKWERGNTTLRENGLHPDTRRAIGLIIQANTTGEVTEATKLKSTHQRFWGCSAFIEKFGRLPSPVIGATTNRGLMIFDGYHRLAALFHLGKAEGFDLPMWLGQP